MPKPLDGVQGSGMHTHLSLFEGDDERLPRPAATRYGLSKVGRGLHRRRCCATPARSPPITNQLVNSYKRLIVGFEAPVYVAWARNNRSALVRVPDHQAGKASSTRIEYRAPDPACNPYLAFSVMLAAGLKGIEEGYELPPEASANVFELTAEERAAEGIAHAARSRSPRRST